MNTLCTNIRVAAVVVTYNRHELLLQCLDALSRQTQPLSAVFLVDNASTDGTSCVLRDHGYIAELPPESVGQPYEIVQESTPQQKQAFADFYYVRMPDNGGGAAGFCEGMQRAMAHGYDWIWLLDDDGKPHADALANLLDPDLGPVVRCALVVDPKEPQRLSFGLRIQHQAYYWIADLARFVEPGNVLPYPGNFFNSVLLPQSLVQQIGFPNPDFFIWGDELEYLFRILSHGHRVITVPSSIHEHPRPSAHTAPGWKIYYLVRNSLVLLRLYPRYRYSELVLLGLVKICMVHSLRGKNIRYILRGLWDGLLQRMGKRVMPA